MAALVAGTGFRRQGLLSDDSDEGHRSGLMMLAAHIPAVTRSYRHLRASLKPHSSTFSYWLRSHSHCSGGLSSNHLSIPSGDNISSVRPETPGLHPLEAYGRWAKARRGHLQRHTLHLSCFPDRHWLVRRLFCTWLSQAPRPGSPPAIDADGRRHWMDGRWAGPTHGPWRVSIPVISVINFILLFAGAVYDLIIRRRIHPVYRWAIPYALPTSTPLRFLLGSTSWGNHLAHWIAGM